MGLLTFSDAMSRIISKWVFPGSKASDIAQDLISDILWVDGRRSSSVGLNMPLQPSRIARNGATFVFLTWVNGSFGSLLRKIADDIFNFLIFAQSRE